MNNILSSRFRLLLTLVTIGTGSSPTYKQVFSSFPWGYKLRNFYALVFRAEKDGLVRRIQTKSDNLIKITPAGLTMLVDEYGQKWIEVSDLSARSDTSRSWDKKWRMAIYEMTEKHRYSRDKLRGILGKFGFSMLMRSAYVSPFDVAEGLKTKLSEENLMENILIFTVESTQLGDHRQIAKRAFGLEQIKDGYLAIARRLQFVRGQQIPDKRLRGLKRLKSDILELVAADPHLPAELLPADWPFERVSAAMMKE